MLQTQAKEFKDAAVRTTSSGTGAPVPKVWRFAPPAVLTPEELKRLQQEIGNRAVSDLLKQRVDALAKGKRIDLTAVVEVVTVVPDTGGYRNEQALAQTLEHRDTVPTTSEPKVAPDTGGYRSPEALAQSLGHRDKVPTTSEPKNALPPAEGYQEVVPTTRVESNNVGNPLPVPAVYKPLKTATGYTNLRQRRDNYQDEFARGSDFLPSMVEDIRVMLKGGSAKFGSVAEGMQLTMGWSPEDCAKYLDKVDLIGERKVQPGTPLVRKLSEEERADFELKGGSHLTQGNPPVTFDTNGMFSKFMGSGYAIFVMDKSGRIYAGQHKIGLFHHSSFLAGGDVAGGGEMKVEAGTLKAITNKSGHYWPRAEEMVQVFDEFHSRGVDLTKVDYVHLVGSQDSKTPWGTAFDFLNQYKFDPKKASH